MMHALTSTFRIAVVHQLLAGLLLVMAYGCSAEGTGPSTQTLQPTDSTAAIPNDSSAVPTDSSAIPPADSTAGPPPDSSAAPPTDSTATTPQDSSGISSAILDTRSRLPGIVFASNNMSEQLLQLDTYWCEAGWNHPRERHFCSDRCARQGSPVGPEILSPGPIHPEL